MDTASVPPAGTGTDSETEYEYPFHRPSAVEVPPVYEELRAKCPVAKVRLPSGDEGYVVSRYDDARVVLADPSRCSMVRSREVASLATH